MIDELKDKMREAGYTSFSIVRVNDVLQLKVQETITDQNGKPRFWSVVEDVLGVKTTAGLDYAHLSLPEPFNQSIPEGDYTLT